MRVSLKTPLVLVDDGDLVRTSRENPGWPLSPDVVVEVCSGSDEFAGVVAKIERYVARGSRYAVAIDRATGRVVSRGIAPEGLELDVAAIVDA